MKYNILVDTKWGLEVLFLNQEEKEGLEREMEGSKICVNEYKTRSKNIICDLDIINIVSIKEVYEDKELLGKLREIIKEIGQLETELNEGGLSSIIINDLEGEIKDLQLNFIILLLNDTKGLYSRSAYN